MTSAAFLPTLTNAGTAALAFDLAVGLSGAKEVCKRHGITQQGVTKLLMNPGFRQMITEYKQGWEAPDNAAARVQMKARMAQEDGLLHMFGILADRGASDSDRVAAFREIRNSSDAQPPHAGAGGAHAAGAGPGQNIVINMQFQGKDHRSEVISMEQMPPDPLPIEDNR